jgi:hypothetical protein
MNAVSDRQKLLLGAAAFGYQATGKILGGSAESLLLCQLAQFDGGLILFSCIAQKIFIRATQAGVLWPRSGLVGLGRQQLRITRQKEQAGDQEGRKRTQEPFRTIPGTNAHINFNYHIPLLIAKATQFY